MSDDNLTNVNPIFIKNREALIESQGRTWQFLAQGVSGFNFPSQQEGHRDPEAVRRAQESIKNSPISYAQIDVILGVEDGVLLEELIHQAPQRLRLVFERDPHQMLAVCARLDLSESVRNGRCLLFVGDDLEGVRRSLIYFFERFQKQAAYIQAFAAPRSLESHEGYYRQIMTLIEEAKNFSERLSGDSIEDSLRGLQNTVSNIREVIESLDMRNLERLRNGGGPIISLAGGPSGDLAWDFLERFKNKIPLIACDSVLKPCLDHGIQPDFVTALERDPVVGDLLRGLAIHDRTTLISPPLLLPDSLKAFAGRKTFFATAAPYLESLGLTFLPKIFPGSSAGNLNLSVAAYFGFDQVIMIGHDLAFGHESFQTHLKGTVDPSREQGRSRDDVEKLATGGKVKTQDGTSEVYTIFEYNMFRYQIELFVSGWPRIQWINTSAKGAAIKGCEFRTLTEVAELVKNESFDAFKHARARLYPPSPGQTHDRRYLVEEAARELDKVFAKYEADVRSLMAAFEAGYSQEALARAEALRLNAPPKVQKAVLSILVSDTVAMDRGIEAVKAKFKDSPQLNQFLWDKNHEYFALISRWLPKIRAEYSRVSELAKRRT